MKQDNSPFSGLLSQLLQPYRASPQLEHTHGSSEFASTSLLYCGHEQYFLKEFKRLMHVVPTFVDGVFDVAVAAGEFSLFYKLDCDT